MSHFQRAFTLIELLVTMAIISVLVGMLIVGVSLIGKQNKAKKTVAILGALQTSLQQFMTDKGGAAIRPAPHPALTLAGNQGVAVCGDQRWPMFYGWPTKAVSILGAPQGTVIAGMTAQQRIDYGVTDVDGNGAINAADGSAPAKNKIFLDYVLSFGGGDLALRDLKALDDCTDAGNIFGNSLYSKDGPSDSSGDPKWVPTPGRVKTGAFNDPSAKWKSYRLPGLAIYDAWGNEVVISYEQGKADGGISLISAGADGLLASDPATSQPGATDNIVMGIAPK